jgi:uncharacterized membrane protein
MPTAPAPADETRRRRAPLPGGPLLQAGPFAILVAAAAWTWTQWERIPARLPIHWGISGRPDAWADRTPGRVFTTTVVGLLLTAGILALAFLVARSRRASVEGAAAAEERRLRYLTLAVVLGAEYLVAVTFAALTVMPLVRSPEGPLAAITALSILFVVATCVVLLRGGSRLAAARKGEMPARGEDRHWRWGAVYVNREDPRILVEKRLGLGYTFNFGNFWSWVVMVALAVVPVAIVLLLMLD